MFLPINTTIRAIRGERMTGISVLIVFARTDCQTTKRIIGLAIIIIIGIISSK